MSIAIDALNKLFEDGLIDKIKEALPEALANEVALIESNLDCARKLIEDVAAYLESQRAERPQPTPMKGPAGSTPDVGKGSNEPGL